MKDEDFLKALKHADNSVLKKLYDQFLPPIIRMVENNSGGRADAMDIFQEALIVLFRKSREPNFQLTSSLSTYIYAVCRNLWMKKLNKKSSSEVSIQDAGVYRSDIDIAGAMEIQEKYRLFKAKLDELTGNCREILRLFLDGISMERITAQLGLSSVAYAKKRKFVCKEQLVKLIKSDPSFAELSMK